MNINCFKYHHNFTDVTPISVAIISLSIKITIDTKRLHRRVDMANPGLFSFQTFVSNKFEILKINFVIFPYVMLSVKVNVTTPFERDK